MEKLDGFVARVTGTEGADPDTVLDLDVNGNPFTLGQVRSRAREIGRQLELSDAMRDLAATGMTYAEQRVEAENRVAERERQDEQDSAEQKRTVTILFSGFVGGLFLAAAWGLRAAPRLVN